MEKKDIKWIYLVETFNTHKDGNNGCISASYFSTRAKVDIHVAWLESCAINNNAKEVYSDDNTKIYKLTNGETWTIRVKRSVIDAFDDYVGEA